MIVVDQPAPLFDATVAIEVRDFPVRQPVTITTIQTYPNMSHWQGRATFMSDDEGCVYVARQAPATTPDGTRAELMLERHVAGPGVTRTLILTEGIVGTPSFPRTTARIRPLSC